MYNFLGVSSNLSVLAGTRWQSTLRFRDGVTGEAAALDGVTFEGAVHCDGMDYAIELTLSEADAERNTVLMAIPGLPEGRWEWELWLRSETGHVVRLMEGRVSALGKLVDDTDVFAHRTLDVLLPGDVAKRVQVEWQASTVAVQAMQESLRVAEGLKGLKDDAEDAIERAQDALDKLGTVDNLVGNAEQAAADAAASKEGAEAVLESAKELIAEAPREFIPTISADGYWVLNGVKQPHKAIGEDGLDGDRIVKHLVDSVEDIPTSGETCNSGHTYYVNVPAVLNVLEEVPATTGDWTAWRLPADMVPHGILLSGVVVPAIRNTSSTALWLAVYLREGGTNRSLLTRSKEPKTWTNGADVAWEFAAPIEVPAGAGLELAWAESLEAIGATSAERPGQRLRSFVLNEGGAELRYDANWYGGRTPFLGFTSPHAGKALAYEWFDETGWVCLAGNGAQASRPATATEDGTVKLGTEAPVAQGAPVGVNEAHQMMVPQATTLCSGTITLSTDEVIEGGILIGKDAAGRVVAQGTNVAPAQAFRWGTVKVGSSVPQSMGMPYIIPIGMAASGVRNEYGQDITGQLFNNTVPGGALRTMMKADWVAKGISGWNVGNLPNGSNAVGVMAKKEQFDQTPDEGLVLKKATRNTVAGVRLTDNPLDEETAHVLDAGALNQFYPMRTDVKEWLKSYIETNATMMSIQVMSQAEYDALSSVKAQTLYIVY